MTDGDKMLEAGFAALKNAPPEAGAAFLDRVAEMGLAEQPVTVAPVDGTLPGARGWRAAFGGWWTVSGLATAAAAGFAMGIYGLALPSVTDTQAVDLMPAIDAPFGTLDEEN